MAVAVRSERPYVKGQAGIAEMSEDASMPNAVAPRRAAIALAAGVLGLLLAGTVALWAQYGTAVFFETIRAGFIACFG